MEDGFDKLLYLLISILYAIFSYGKKRTRQKPDEIPLPPSTAAPDWEDDWDEEIEMITPAWEETVEEAHASIHHPPAITSAFPVQPKPSAVQSQPKIEQVLGRYKGWKKTVVMSELIRPYL